MALFLLAICGIRSWQTSRGTSLYVVFRYSLSSSQLHRGEAQQREDEGHDPETDHHLGFLPAAELEVVVERGHAEDALAAQLEGEDLQDDGEGLDDEHAADAEE